MKKVTINLLLTLALLIVPVGAVFAGEACSSVSSVQFTELGQLNQLKTLLNNGFRDSIYESNDRYELCFQNIGEIITSGDEIPIVNSSGKDLLISGLKVSRTDQSDIRPLLKITGHHVIIINSVLSAKNPIELDGGYLKDSVISGKAYPSKDERAADELDYNTEWYNFLSNSGTCIKMTGAEGTVENTTITNCEGKAISIESNNKQTIKNSTITGNYSEWGGLALGLNASNLGIGINIVRSGGDMDMKNAQIEILDNNIITGYRLGLQISGNDVLVQDNRSVDNELFATVLAGGKRVKFKHNTFELVGEGSVKGYELEENANDNIRAPEAILDYETRDGEKEAVHYNSTDLVPCDEDPSIIGCLPQDTQTLAFVKIKVYEPEGSIEMNRLDGETSQFVPFGECVYTQTKNTQPYESSGEQYVECGVMVERSFIDEDVFFAMQDENSGSSMLKSFNINPPTTSAPGITDMPTGTTAGMTTGGDDSGTTSGGSDGVGGPANAPIGPGSVPFPGGANASSAGALKMGCSVSAENNAFAMVPVFLLIAFLSVRPLARVFVRIRRKR